MLMELPLTFNQPPYMKTDGMDCVDNQSFDDRMSGSAAHCLNRIVWNGNDGSVADNEVTTALQWMVQNGDATSYNVSNPDSRAATELDINGTIYTPTSGYSESALGGTSIEFHGPFQRWMNMGETVGDDEGKVGFRVHLMRCVGSVYILYSIK